MAKYRCYDIEWETDGQDVDVPDELIVEIDHGDGLEQIAKLDPVKDAKLIEDIKWDCDLDEDAINDYLCGKISDISGWLHHGFGWERIED